MEFDPHIWAHTRERYWSAKIDDISLWPPEVAYIFIKTATDVWRVGVPEFDMRQVPGFRQMIEYLPRYIIYNNSECMCVFSSCNGGKKQCSGSAILIRAGTADPKHWITDPVPGPALFFSDFQDANKR